MRWVGRGASLLLGLALVLVASTSRLSSILCGLGTVVVLSVLMIRARRREPELRATRTWMLTALLTGVASGIAAVVDNVVRPGADYPRAGDLVELLYIPCALTALMYVPLREVRRGFRARAVSDGLIATSSLLFVLEPLLSDVAGEHDSVAANVVALAIPLGGVLVVSAALTAYARCTDEVRPVLRWIAIGVSLMAGSDLVFAVSPTAVPGLRRSVLQLGLTTILGATVTYPSRASSSARRYDMARLLAVLPFLPFVAAVVRSSSLVVRGQGLDATQLVIAVAVGLALVLRQYVGGRDKTRLVEELGRREALLHQELRLDPLTGVANRLGLEEALAAGLDDRDQQFELVLVDLNDFKLVNDNHGHAIGDEVLRQVAHRLSSCVREGDVVARMGGDEFAVLMNGPPRMLSTVSQRLVDALAVPVVVGERRFRISASVGLVGKQDGDTVARLLADADGAMYEAKADRSASSLVRLDHEGRKSVAWRSRVREQIAHPVLDDFEVLYQPVVALGTGEIRGVEALLRWNHPTSGAVPPDVFIPLAEQCGSITVLGHHVLRTAVKSLASLSRLAPDVRLTVGVNVSPRQLTSAGFAPFVSETLAHSGLAPDQLVVEITEQAFDADVDSMQETVRRLVADGVAIAVDDFGTGYSTLSYLQQLDLDVLKIDRTFVAGIGKDGRQERLLDGIAALAGRMNLQVVAEGIETPAQLALLQQFGCELGQGYLFSKPVPLATIVGLVRAQHRYDVPATSGPLPVPRSEALPWPSGRRG